MAYLLEVLVILVMVALLAADVRAIVLLYRAKRGNEEQCKRLHKQMKEFASL